MQLELAAVYRRKKSWPSQDIEEQSIFPESHDRQQNTVRRWSKNSAGRGTSCVSSRRTFEVFWNRIKGLRLALACCSRSCSCPLSRYFAMVGRWFATEVDASIANTTASASGTNRYRATPPRRNMGTKTMQIAMVETNAGIAIWAAPSKMACSTSLPSSRLRLMFSISTVASSTRFRRQRQSAERHDVDGLS